jgi:hypothetical protein
VTAPIQDILDFVDERGIQEILHFTTNRGLIGILAAGKLLSRDQLREEELLTEIAMLNAPDRSRDADWTGYVNMSITSANYSFMESSKGWHPDEDIWWAILAFEPAIVADEGVHFTTSNNAYPTTQRAPGVGGLKALYRDGFVWGKFGSKAWRTSFMDPAQPTHNQAEVLYPKAVGLAHLLTIYVAEDEHIDAVAGWISAFARSVGPDLSAVHIVCDPALFPSR